MGRRVDIKPLPSLERLNELFTYDSVTGDLRWKAVPASFKRAKVGDVAGTVGPSHGYRVVGIERAYYYAHRIIWKIVTGEDPVDQVDHIDGDRLNNRFANFRESTNGQNRWNTKIAKNNRSGVKGVCWDSSRRVWVASIDRARIGRFKVKQDAINARLNAAAEMHGEFMRIA